MTPAATFGTLYADIPDERLDWLSRGRVARGCFTILVGPGGAGKSCLFGEHAARMSTGDPPFPGDDPRPPMGVLMITAEDSEGSVIKPRLRAAGADMGKVIGASLIDANTPDARPFAIPRDWPVVDAVLRQNAAAGTPIGLVVIDPLHARLEESYKYTLSQDARRAMGPGFEVIKAHGAALIGLIHMNSRPGGSAVERVSGGRHWVDMARFALQMGRNDRGEHVLAVSKTNHLAAPALAYDVVGVPYRELYPPEERVKLDPEDRETAARFVWLGESDSTADDLAATRGGADPDERAEHDSADRLVLAALEPGHGVAIKDLTPDARAAGIGENALRRALRRHAEDRREGFQAPVLWHKKTNGHRSEPVPGPDRSILVCHGCGSPVSAQPGPCPSCGDVRKKAIRPEEA